MDSICVADLGAMPADFPQPRRPHERIFGIRDRCVMRRFARSGQHLRDARISCVDKFQIIPAGRWFRIEGTTPKGGSDEDRPHLIPITAAGRNLVEIDATGFIGRTGLCPGEVTLDDDSKVLAYRFINLPEEAANDLIEQLDAEIEKLQKAAND